MRIRTIDGGQFYIRLTRQTDSMNRTNRAAPDHRYTCLHRKTIKPFSNSIKRMNWIKPVGIFQNLAQFLHLEFVQREKRIAAIAPFESP